jgi:uncharacterized protein (DUF2252 family)
VGDLATTAGRRSAYLTLDERRALGREAAERTPPKSHAGWRPAADRPDPIGLLVEQNRSREADLVPVRHGRMMVSPFTFFRGAATVMAADLAGTPTAGLTVQLCGDAHLSNFGAFGSPERRLVFDLNDFDETLPGPFEYDVKRLAASFTIAARHNGFRKADTAAVTLAVVASYEQAMAEFAQMGTMDVWYAHLSEADILAAARTGRNTMTDKKGLKTLRKNVDRARTRDSLQALSKLAERVDGRYRIVSRPPVIVPMRELENMYELSAAQVEGILHAQFEAYRQSLPDDRRALLERFTIVDVARKVVGVGSVGTGAYIALLQGRDDADVLFLQVKEATSSVLERDLPKSVYPQHGERVVQGQRLTQGASDIFLGWGAAGPRERHFYWRQLRDMKGSAIVEAMSPTGMSFYAGLCGWTLARAHARSGDPVALAEYLRDDDGFARSIADFAKRYADQNDRDYQAFVVAIRAGDLSAAEGV